jgi:hypothetical protein
MVAVVDNVVDIRQRRVGLGGTNILSGGKGGGHSVRGVDMWWG